MAFSPVITNLETGNRVHFAEWIAVGDRLPDDDTVVLVACPDASEPVWLGFYSENEWVDPEYFRIIINVTHWMPLPELPAELTTDQRG